MADFLFVKRRGAGTLTAFVHTLAEATDRSWEERESCNFPMGGYHRAWFDDLEIIAQIADDPDLPDYDFMIWARNSRPRTKADGILGLIEDLLKARGYIVMRQS